MTGRPILIFTAVQMETKAIRAALPEATVHTVGIRAVRLPDARQLAGFSAIVMAGLAGALSPRLKIGDVIIDDPDNLFPCSSAFEHGRIHTADQIMASPAEKAALFASTGALAVDMEQKIVRNFAAGLKIPLIGLRAISDTADQFLDPAVVGFIDDQGRPRPIKIAEALLRRPAMARYLISLHASTKFALDRLGRAMLELV